MKKLFAFAVAAMFAGGVAFAQAPATAPKKEDAKTEAPKKEDAKKTAKAKKDAEAKAKKDAEATKKPEDKK